MNSKKSRSILALLISLNALPAFGQGAPDVRVVRYEQIGGGVESPNGAPVSRALQIMPKDRYGIRGEVYSSGFNRMNIKIPRIGNETLVDVREAISLVRADGSPATTHLMFDAGGTPVMPGLKDPVSAVVVTRLREDRSKDGNVVLDGIDGGTNGRELYAKSGFEYSFSTTKLGPAMRRIIPNRTNSFRFPYRIEFSNSAEPLTYGVTVYLVASEDSFIEFSQIFPCDSKGREECRSAALLSSQSFINGMSQFRSYPKPEQGISEKSSSLKVE